MSKEDEKEENHVSMGKTVSYGFTSVVDSLIIIMYQQTVFYFYEVEVGLSVALVGLAYVIFAIWNMINDPLIGFLTDKPRKWSKKYGVRKPWILIGIIFTALFFFLLYTPPDIDPEAYPFVMFFYMIIITCLYDTFYSLYTTHFQGGFANYFRRDDDRRKASAIHRVIGTLGRFIGATIIIPFTIVYGDKSSFVRAGLLAVIVMLVCLILFYPGIKEDEDLRERHIRSYGDSERTSFFQMLRYAFKSKNYVVNLITFTLFTLSYSLYQANFIYFFKDALMLEMVYQTFGSLLFFLGIIGSTPIWFLIAKKIGNTRVYLISFFLTGISWIVISIQVVLIGFILAAFFIGLCLGGFLVMTFVILADTLDEYALKSGKHLEAGVMGITNFFLRSGYLAVGVIIAIVHILTGYNPDPTATQTPLAVLGVRLITGLIPAIFSFTGAIVFLLFYDLKGEKKLKMIAMMREKGL